MSCVYNLEGQIINDRRALDNLIINKYLSDKDSDIVFEKSEILQISDILESSNKKEKLAKIKQDIAKKTYLNLQRSGAFNEDWDIKEVYSDRFLGVTDFISKSDYVNLFDVDNYRKQKTILINSNLNNLNDELTIKVREKLREIRSKNSNLTEEEIKLKAVDAVVQDIIDSWEYIRKCGKVVDAIFGIVMGNEFSTSKYLVNGHFDVKLFLDKYTHDQEGNLINDSWYDLEGLYSTSPDGSYKSPILDGLIQQAVKLKRELRISPADTVYTQYVTEYEDADGSGLRAKIDLIVFRGSDGSVEIYDIKSSTKNAGSLDKNSEWDRDKIKSTKYLLGIYQKMIQALGIDPSRISTSIIPVVFNGVTYNKSGSTLENVFVDSPVRLVLNANEDLEIIKNINNRIIIKPEINLTADGFKQDIISDLESVFPTMLLGDSIFNADNEFYTRAGKIKRYGTKYKFKMITEGGSEKWSPEYDSTQEAIEAYKKYHGELLDSDKTLFTARKGLLRNALSRFNRGLFNIEKEKIFDHRVLSNVQLNFRKYFSESGWRVLTDTDSPISNILDDLGAIVLINDSNPETPLIDVISLLSINLSQEVKLLKGNNIYGQFQSKNEDPKAPKSTIGNIGVMRNMMIANHLAKLMPNVKFGDFSIYNMSGIEAKGQMVSGSSQELLKRFNKLSVLGNFLNNLVGNKIISTEELFKRLFEGVINTTYEGNKFLQGTDLSGRIKSTANLLSNLITLFGSSSANNKAEWLKTLNELWTDLNKYFAKHHEDQNAIISGNSYEHFLYRETARLLAENMTMFMDLYNFNPLTNYGLWEENLGELLKNREFGNGISLNTADTIPIIKSIFEELLKRNLAIRLRYEHYKDSDNKTRFKKIIGATNLSMTLVSKFYDNSDDGKTRFLFKNPETANDLTNDEKEFLTWYLRKMNALKVGKEWLTDEEDHHEKESGTYLEVPLLKASTYSRIVNGKVYKHLHYKEVWNRTVDNVTNLRNQAPGNEISYKYIKGQDDYRDLMDMYDVMSIQGSARETMLGDVDNKAEEFEMHLEVLLDEMAKSKIVKQEYNKILPGITAAMYTLQTLGYSSGIDTTKVTEFILKFLRSSVFNESLLPDSDILKVVLKLKRDVSGAILGFNFLSAGKEVLNGIFYHYTRAIANMGDKDRCGLVDVTRGYTSIWKDAFEQIAVQTFWEKINLRYGMSNMDVNSLVGNANYHKDELLRFKDRLFWTARAPDFLNRMTIMAAYMYKYGCKDAYKVDDSGKLVYNWRDDARFNLLATNNKSNMKAYNELKALYSAMMNDFVELGREIWDEELKGWRLINWNSNNFNDETNDVMPDAFTNKQAMAMKQESDMAFGYMDHDTKSLMFKEGITAIFLQFKTFITAKKAQYLLTPNEQFQGFYKQLKNEKREVLYKYIKETTDENGLKHYDVELVTTPTVTENGLEMELEPMYVWEGQYMEGMLWSLIDCVNFLKWDNLKDAWRNPMKRRNAIIILEELALLGFIMWLISALYGNRKELSKLDNYFERNMMTMLSNASYDLNPYQVVDGNLTLDWTMVLYLQKVGLNIGGIITGDDSNNVYTLMSKLGATSTFRKELYDNSHDLQRKMRMMQ